MTLEEFDSLYPSLSKGFDSATFNRLCGVTLDVPAARSLEGLDPFSTEYRQRAVDIYLSLRGKDDFYDPARDEQSHLGMPGNIWTDVTPWSFKDPTFIAEFFFCWGHILHALQLDANSPAKVLEYGAGSGQLALFLARIGVQSFVADIDPDFLNVIAAQAERMDLRVRTDCAVFGEGFDGETFDRIIFFEAFHHAIDFLDLLNQLKTRLAPGGRLVFAGEPVFQEPVPSVPYPWGPRLDALSVFCIRHYGWMELGFIEPFFIQALELNGYDVSVRRFPGCPRANVYVAEVAGSGEAEAPSQEGPAPRPPSRRPVEITSWAQQFGEHEGVVGALKAHVAALETERKALTSSTSWRLTAPLRRLVMLARRRGARAGRT